MLYLVQVHKANRLFVIESAPEISDIAASVAKSVGRVRHTRGDVRDFVLPRLLGGTIC